ncbi:MAG: S8 family serine peptidase [Candidatus Diapherotrites archaeon]
MILKKTNYALTILALVFFGFTINTFGINDTFSIKEIKDIEIQKYLLQKKSSTNKEIQERTNSELKLSKTLQEKRQINSGKEYINVIISLKNERLNDIIKKNEEKYKEKTKRYVNSLKEILKENNYSVENKNKVKEILDRIDYENDIKKKEIYLEQKKIVQKDQQEIQKIVENCGGVNKGSTALANQVFAKIPQYCLDNLIKNDLVVKVYEDKINKINLETSVCTIGAYSWYNNDYNGYSNGVWDLAIVDTGIDSTHPALPATYGKVFHDTAKTNSDYADDYTSSDDLHGHGTHVAGIISSKDALYKGVANGIDKIINAKVCYLATDGYGYCYFSDEIMGLEWAITEQGADVINRSIEMCIPEEEEDCIIAKILDLFVDYYGVTIVNSAGNNGPNPSTISAVAYNAISVASTDDKKTCSISDDTISFYSGRGPTLNGRIKPDIAAPGNNIISCNSEWEGNNPDFVQMSGTSMAAPHVAGAAILINSKKGYIPDPKEIKALLINSANSKGVFGNKNDFGWGIMDLSNAYNSKDYIDINLLTKDYQYKYYNGNLKKDQKATLVWNRHLKDRIYFSDLDLYLFNESDNSLLDYSISAVDNVEQVESPGDYNVVLIINAYYIDSNSDIEEFAIATEGSFKAVNIINPSIDLNVPNKVPKNSFTITAQIQNNSDLKLFDTNVTLNLPPDLKDLNVINGSNKQNIGMIMPKEIKIISWDLNVPYGTYNDINASFSAVSYGLNFNYSTQNYTITIYDGIPPTLNEITPIALITNDNTPEYTFSSTEMGTLTYEGDCNSDTTTVIEGINTITFNTLPDGNHYNCAIQVTDQAGNTSEKLNITSFIIDTTPPIIISQTPLNNSYITNLPNATFTINYSEENLELIKLYWNETWPFACENINECPPLILNECENGSNKTCDINLNLSNYSNDQKIKYYFEIVDKVENSTNGLDENGSPYNLTIDTIPPMTNSDANNTWQNFDARIRLTCQEVNGSGCNNLRYRIDMDPTNEILYGLWQDYNQSILINQDGNWAIEFNSTDKAGNTENAKTQYILIDKTPPTTMAQSENYNFKIWAKSDITVILYCDDQNKSGCNNTKYCTDTTNSCEPTIEYSSPINITTKGVSYIRFKSQDALQNIEQTKSKIIKIIDSNQIIADNNYIVIDTTINEIIVQEGSIIKDIKISSEIPFDKYIILNLSSLLDDNNIITLPNEINLTRESDYNYLVNIQNGTIIQADSDWNGLLIAPTIKINPKVNPIPDNGKNINEISKVIEIGYEGKKITLDKAARILIPNQAGKDVGYSIDNTFYKITEICLEDSQTTNNVLPKDKECKIDVNSDLVIWTKHFTEFLVYSQSTTNNNTQTDNSTTVNNESTSNSLSSPPISSYAGSSSSGGNRLVKVSENEEKIDLEINTEGNCIQKPIYIKVQKIEGKQNVSNAKIKVMQNGVKITELLTDTNGEATITLDSIGFYEFIAESLQMKSKVKYVEIVDCEIAQTDMKEERKTEVKDITEIKKEEDNSKETQNKTLTGFLSLVNDKIKIIIIGLIMLLSTIFIAYFIHKIRRRIK